MAAAGAGAVAVVGANSLAGVIAAVIFQTTGSVPLGITAALLVGAGGGAFNGFLVSYSVGIEYF